MLEPGLEPNVLAVDKVNDCDPIREDLIARKGGVNYSRASDPQGTRRNPQCRLPVPSLIECCFNKREYSRSLAIRYDKVTKIQLVIYS